MTLMTHIEQLKSKHRNLTSELEIAQRSPAMDGLHLTALKKQKLRLKEEIERLQST